MVQLTKAVDWRIPPPGSFIPDRPQALLLLSQLMWLATPRMRQQASVKQTGAEHVDA
ncbi:hypothetical protein [Rhizobium leguminosarum]|uniref:hypothetical protein n=1 Tax=Rhizobium leguminosarum TaxID=384 RepID=UPI0021BBC39E|nr:hypothetical protein [Rhizobium leguminosarum]